jgi:ABC-type bacteriocin/lantibiotic exporter with double-glycine peptidase domain
MRKPFAGAALLLGGAFLFLGGCRGHGPAAGGGYGPSAAGVAEGWSPPPAASARVLSGVPFLPQEEDSCGPSSLAMVLQYLGRDARTYELIRETRTEGLRGTLITDLAAAARRRGVVAEIENLDLEGLRESIASGVPPILLVDVGTWVLSRPHFLVAYGWTPDGVVAHSGRERGKVIPVSVLDRQWAKMNRLALILREPPP